MSGAIAKALEDAAEKTERGLAQDFSKGYHDVLKETEQKATKVAEHATENEASTVGDLGKAAERGRPDVADPRASEGGSGAASSRSGGGRPGGDAPDLGASRPGGGQATEGNGNCHTDGDPVDVVSGQMITSATDLELPGLLPLLLRRAYASGYSAGTLFGPGWSSTLTQRVQIDRQGIHYAGDDGQILHYPVPTQPGQQVYPADGPRWPLSWDRTEDVVRIERPEAGWTCHFPALPDGSGTGRPIARVTDRNSHRIDHLYDASGHPVEVRHSSGRRVAVDLCHTSAGPRIESLRLLDGTNGGEGTTVRSFGYDALGRLTDVTDSSGVPFVYRYDAEDRITACTDRNQHWYAYSYGADGRVARGHGPDGVLTAVFRYDLQQRTTVVTNGLGHSTTYRYDEHGHVSDTTDAAGHTVRTVHDRFGRMLSHEDPLGRLTRFTLDEGGRPLRVDRSDGKAWTARYDAWGLPLEVSAPDGTTWRHSYDEHGNRTATYGPDGTSTRYSYDGAGRLTGVTDTLGRTTRFRRDAAGLTLEVRNPLGAKTSYRRDAFGRPTEVTDAIDATTRFSWTPEGRLGSRTAPDGSVQRWAYDAEGNLVEAADQIGAVTRREFGPFNRLTAVTEADGTRHTFAYDTELRLTAVDNPEGLTWRYERDALGRVLVEHDFNGRTVHYERDAVGRLLSRTNGAGQVVTYTYDASGNLLTKVSDGVTASYEHDAADRLVRASSVTAEVVRHYDAAGRLVQESINGRSISYGYNELGQRTTRTTPSGHSSVWSYDEAGRPLSLSAAGNTVGFERDLLGREVARRLPGELSLRSCWDQQSRLASQNLYDTEQESALESWTYGYRADGQLVHASDAYSGDRSFELDPLGRVTAVRTEDPARAERYTYDGTGNLVDVTWPEAGGRAAQGSRSYQGTLVRRAGRVHYEHDAQGRVTLRRRTTLSGRTEVWTFSWDAEDRLTSATTPSGEQWRYVYDPFGRRIAKQRLVPDGDTWAVTEWTDFTWDATTLAEQTSQGPGLPGPYTLTWDHQGLQPVAQTERLVVQEGSTDQRFFSIVTDLVGAPIQLLNPDGSAAWQRRATLWGLGGGGEASVTSTPLRFPGQYDDPETRLHYNVHRYYDPALAGYLSPDPLGLLPSPNPHSYVKNPLRTADPLGLAPAEPPPLGEHANPFPTREAAERAAFQLAGVPYGTEPLAQWQIGGDKTMIGMPNYNYSSNPTHWGEMRQYETDNGSRLIIEHTDDPAGSHFHAGMGKDDKSGKPRELVNFGWGGTDPVRDGFERYQKIDKPGGDHHLFYQGGKVCPG